MLGFSFKTANRSHKTTRSTQQPLNENVFRLVLEYYKKCQEPAVGIQVYLIYTTYTL